MEPMANNKAGKKAVRNAFIISGSLYVFLCCVLCTPFLIALWMQFRHVSPTQYTEDYDNIVELVEEGSLCRDVTGDCPLPQEYEHLSKNGEMWIDRTRKCTSIFFWMSTGILGEGTGYIYRSDDSPPTEVIWCDEWHRSDRLYWFYCSSL